MPAQRVSLDHQAQCEADDEDARRGRDTGQHASAHGGVGAVEERLRRLAGQQGDRQGHDEQHPRRLSKDAEAGQALEQVGPAQGEEDQAQADSRVVATPAPAQERRQGGRGDPQQAKPTPIFPRQRRGRCLQGRAHEEEKRSQSAFENLVGSDAVGPRRESRGLQGRQELHRSQCHRQKRRPGTVPRPAEQRNDNPPSPHRSHGSPDAGLFQGGAERPQGQEEAGVEGPLRMRAEDQQGKGGAGRRGPGEAAQAHGSVEQQERPGEPRQTNGDVVPGRQQVQHPLASQHEAAPGDQCRRRVEPPSPGAGICPPAGEDHVHHDQPAQAGADVCFGQEQQWPVGRVEHGHLRVMNKRGTGELVGAPERQFARLLPRTHQEALGRQVLGEQVGMVRVEHLRRVPDQVGKEEQGEGSQDQGRDDSEPHNTPPV